uniref:Uncharacterized protein n=1 Tax=Romanomermis culicivorax TaxID=13658 RepID=A0A915HXE2_ROMCU
MAIEREAAQRRQAEIERERRIREMKEREAQRRRQFEERRKALQDQETERRMKIMAKYTSSTSSINSSNCGNVNQKSASTTPHIIFSPQKRKTATAPVYAFGSSTPRTLSYLEKLKSDMKAYDARLKSAPSTISSAIKGSGIDQSQRASSSLSRQSHQATPTRTNTTQRTISSANLNGRKSET